MCIYMGLPWWLSGRESACNAGDTGEAGSIPGLGRSLEECVAIHSSFLPGEYHGQRNLAGYIHRVTKNQTWLKQLSTRSYIYISFFVSLSIYYHVYSKGTKILICLILCWASATKVMLRSTEYFLNNISWMNTDWMNTGISKPLITNRPLLTNFIFLFLLVHLETDIRMESGGIQHLLRSPKDSQVQPS